jgi:Phage tail lysozyme
MTPRQAMAMQFFVSHGYSVKGSAAIVGNLSQESTVNLHSGFTARTDHGSQGIAQWRLERLTGLQRFCEQKGLDAQILGSQLLYIEWELKNLPRKGLGWLNAMLVQPGQRSIANLTANFSTYFESPSKRYENLDFRIAEATKCADTYVPQNNTGPIAAGGVAATGAIGTTAYVWSQGITGPILAVFVTLSVAAVMLLASFLIKRKASTTEVINASPTVTRSALDELMDAIDEFKAIRGRVDAAEAVVLMHRNESDKLLAELKELKGDRP